MRPLLLLADYGQVSPDQKLHAIGIGWTFTGPDVAGPMAIVGVVEVDWNETNRPHPWRIQLHDADGAPVMVQEQQIAVDGVIEVGRPPGHPEGTPLVVPLAINFGPLPITGPARYSWIVTIDERSDPAWTVSFNVRGSR